MRKDLREVYFTEKELEKQADFLLKKIERFRKRAYLDIMRPALLILDMQKYFLSEESHAFVPSAKAIIPNVKLLQDTFLKKNLPVIQTRHLNSNENAKQMRKWWKDLIKAGDPLSEITDDLKDERAVIIEKNQYDAFYETPLEAILKERNIDQVVICGVMTHLCCETTARSAFVRGFDVIFPVDATATYNKNFHLSSILNLSHGFAVIAKTREIVRKLERGT